MYAAIDMETLSTGSTGFTHTSSQDVDGSGTISIGSVAASPSILDWWSGASSFMIAHIPSFRQTSMWAAPSSDSTYPPGFLSLNAIPWYESDSLIEERSPTRRPQWTNGATPRSVWPWLINRLGSWKGHAMTNSSHQARLGIFLWLVLRGRERHS